MAILVDPATWPGRGRLWCHLVSDTSFEELHAFARACGIPERGFERDRTVDVEDLMRQAKRYRQFALARRCCDRRLAAVDF